MIATPPTPQDLDLTFVDQTVQRLGREEAALIPILQALQQHYRYLPDAALRRVCEQTAITPASITGVTSFYRRFRTRPVGRHLVSICHGTACHVKNAPMVTDALRRHLQLNGSADTDPQGLFTLEQVACLGCCTLAPVIKVDETIFGHLRPESIPQTLERFLQQQSQSVAQKKTLEPEKAHRKGVGEIRLVLDSCCVANGTETLHQQVQQTLYARGISIPVRRIGCHGMCHRTPMLELALPDGQLRRFAELDQRAVDSVLQGYFRPGNLWRRFTNCLSTSLDRLLTDGGKVGEPPATLDPKDRRVINFSGPQVHIATEHPGKFDPLCLQAYRAHDGFAAMEKALADMTPAQVVDQVDESQLRGRGGGGFPTGRKWRMVAQAPGPIKYLICNGDEGDPGAFMDRMLLESFPYRVIEGMILAAYAVGATEGIFYVRHEYPYAVKRLTVALEQCYRAGILGENIMGSTFSFDLSMKEGAGAFVCGEETALIASLEGRRGMPRLRPPFPAQQGLWDKPTLINNVETYACVPWIIRNGATAFAEIGTPTSKGTKVFSLAGKVRHGGLIEVPMGLTLREIVEGIGGGIPGNRRFKAVQIGGPSGGCIPARLADHPVDYQTLQKLGAIMGSGGLVVLDETDCMVDIARYFLAFTQIESCGKCTFCRIGTRRMHEILERICGGKGKASDITELENLAAVTTQGSICGLGRTAPTPVLTTLRYFRDEYEAHLIGHCPAGRCSALTRYVVNDACIGCTRCAVQCPVQAIALTPYVKHEIDEQTCIRCDACRVVCPSQAVEVV